MVLDGTTKAVAVKILLIKSEEARSTPTVESLLDEIIMELNCYCCGGGWWLLLAVLLVASRPVSFCDDDGVVANGVRLL